MSYLWQFSTFSSLTVSGIVIGIIMGKSSIEPINLCHQSYKLFASYLVYILQNPSLKYNQGRL